MLVRGSHSNVRAQKMPDSKDPEFPGRNQSPGPDDVYDPLSAPRDNTGTYGPYYFDSPSRDEGSLTLF